MHWLSQISPSPSAEAVTLGRLDWSALAALLLTLISLAALVLSALALHANWRSAAAAEASAQAARAVAEMARAVDWSLSWDGHSSAMLTNIGGRTAYGVRLTCRHLRPGTDSSWPRIGRSETREFRAGVPWNADDLMVSVTWHHRQDHSDDPQGPWKMPLTAATKISGRSG